MIYFLFMTVCRFYHLREIEDTYEKRERDYAFLPTVLYIVHDMYASTQEPHLPVIHRRVFWATCCAHNPKGFLDSLLYMNTYWAQKTLLLKGEHTMNTLLGHAVYNRESTGGLVFFKLLYKYKLWENVFKALFQQNGKEQKDSSKKKKSAQVLALVT